MTAAQRVVLGLGATLLAVMLVLPPFHEVSAMGRVGDSLGYHLVGQAPEDSAIDWAALGIQALAATVLMAGFWLALRKTGD